MCVCVCVCVNNCGKIFFPVICLRRKIGWKENGNFSNRLGKEKPFFGRGFTTADLKIDGKIPDNKEELMMVVRVGIRSARKGLILGSLLSFKPSVTG